MSLILMLVPVPGSAAEKSVGRESLARALQRTEKYFSAQEVHGDVGYFLGQGAKFTGRKPVLKLVAQVEQNRDKYPISLEYHLWISRDFPLFRQGVQGAVPASVGFVPAKALFLRQESPGLPAEYNRQLAKLITIMSNALSCQKNADIRGLIGPAEYEYVAAHQLSAFVFAFQRGCMDSLTVLMHQGPYLSRVYDEFKTQKLELTDLQVERAAVLSMVGRFDLVPASFIDKLVRQQTKQGIWVLNDPLRIRGVMPVEHTAALAYFVLSAAYAAR